jgi:hypothetical protein
MKLLQMQTAVLTVLACSACHSLTPAEQAKVDRLECEAHALEPVAEADAKTLVGMIEDGRLTLIDVMELVAPAQATEQSVVDAFHACRGFP